jgi:N-methylhydantoinase B
MVSARDRAVALDASISSEVTRNGLSAIADEMAITHVRAAYSTVVRDMVDFSTAICDGSGRVVAQGLSLALQLGAIPRFMQALLERVDRPRRGDVYLLNHPWQGGVHLPDFFFARPVFVEDRPEPIAFTVLVSHMVDVGGRFPGGISAQATSLWDEGLVIPLVPLVREGVVNDALIDVIAANSREPSTVLGDIRAVLAGLEIGARQVLALAERRGVGGLLDDIAHLLGATEAATRSAIARLADGEAAAVGALDDDGSGADAVRLRCRAIKRGASLCFDFSGSSPETRTGLNCTAADVMSAVAFVTRAGLGEEIPVNDGFYRCLEFVAPDGTVINARYPAAVGARGSTIRRLADVAMMAMAALAPGRLPATPGGPGVVFMSGELESGRSWVLLDMVQSGWGATRAAPGPTGLSHPIANAANVPVEVIEQRYPVRVHAHEMVPGTGGSGAFAGSDTVVREYEALADGTVANVRAEREVLCADGAQGGGSGRPARCLVRRRNGDWEPLPATSTTTLHSGDRLRIELASGGGFGSESKRP